MNATKEREVIEAVSKDVNADEQEIRDFIYANWSEPDHAEWLITASVQEIVDWVIAGLEANQ